MSPATTLEHQTIQEVVKLVIAPQVQRRERRLVFEVTRPPTRAQTNRLNEQVVKLFERYSFKDEREIKLDALLLEAHGHRKILYVKP